MTSYLNYFLSKENPYSSEKTKTVTAAVYMKSEQILTEPNFVFSSYEEKNTRENYSTKYSPLRINYLSIISTYQSYCFPIILNNTHILYSW